MGTFIYQWSMSGQCSWILLAVLAFALCWRTAWAEFHKLILAPRTSSKVEVFSYSSKKGSICKSIWLPTNNQTHWGVLLWSFHLGATTSGLSGCKEPAWSVSFSWHGDVAGSSSFGSLQPSVQSCAAAALEQMNTARQRVSSWDLNHSHWHTGSHIEVTGK